MNLDEERFITYSYACVDQENWQDEKKLKYLEKEFYRFAGVYSSNHKADFENLVTGTMRVFRKTKSEMYGFTKVGTVVLTSDSDIENYTTLPYKFEREHFYTYILELYKKISLTKFNAEFNNFYKFSKAQDDYINFAKELWIEEVTNNDTGSSLLSIWKDQTKSDEIFMKLKNKYDIMYKNSAIVKAERVVDWILAGLVVILVINVISIAMK